MGGVSLCDLSLRSRCVFFVYCILTRLLINYEFIIMNYCWGELIIDNWQLIIIVGVACCCLLINYEFIIMNYCWGGVLCLVGLKPNPIERVLGLRGGHFVLVSLCDLSLWSRWQTLGLRGGYFVLVSLCHCIIVLLCPTNAYCLLPIA